MRREIAHILRNPSTGAQLKLDVIKEDNGEIITGTLGDYPVMRGVPYLYNSVMNTTQQQTMDSFSAKWALAPDYREDTNKFYWQWYLKRYAEGDESALVNQISSATTILDAGTGLGRDAEHFKQITDADVFAVDLSLGIHTAYDRLHHTGIHFIRCDIAHLPFEHKFFDFISCDQVLHHTQFPSNTLAHLARHLSPNGSLNFYVYKRKAPMREVCDDYLRDITTNYSVDECLGFSAKLADIGKQLTEMNQSITIKADIPELGITAGTYDLQRFFYWNFIKMFYNADFSWKDNIAVNFDWYHPSCAQRYTRDEVESMVDRAGLRIDSFHESDAGYSVRTTK